MFLDDVVIAGLLVIGVTTVIMVWFGVVAYRHIKRDKK